MEDLHILKMESFQAVNRNTMLKGVLMLKGSGGKAAQAQGGPLDVLSMLS